LQDASSFEGLLARSQGRQCKAGVLRGPIRLALGEVGTRLRPIQARTKERINRLAGHFENLPERGVGSSVVPVIDVGVGKQDREADLVEVIAPASRLVEEALEDRESVVVATLHHVAATESVCSGGGVAWGQLTRSDGLHQQGDAGLDLIASQCQTPKSELHTRVGLRRVCVRAGSFVEFRRPVLVAEPKGDLCFQQLGAEVLAFGPAGGKVVRCDSKPLCKLVEDLE